MKEKIVVLGASSLQVPLINYIKSLGFYVIVVSIPGDYPGFDIADKCIFADVRDVDIIYEQIKNEKIVAILTDQTDISVPSVAMLSSKLGLPANSIEMANKYSNKYLLRTLCDEIGLSNVKFFRASNVDEIINTWSIYPAIIKPEDSQGSRGVYKIHNEDDLSKFFNKSIQYSRTGHIIIEEYFEGKEVVAEGFVYDGKYMNLGIADRKYFNINNLFIPSQTIFPSNIPDYIKNKIFKYENQIHGYICPRFGLTHSEYLYNVQTGDIRIVETALRGGGVYTSSHLIPLYTGINVYEILVKYALGKPVFIDEYLRQINNKASAYMCFYLPEGCISQIDGIDEILNLPEVVMFDRNNVEIGSQTHFLVNKTNRLGPIIIQASNRDEIDRTINIVQNMLHITVQTKNGLCKDVYFQ